MKKSIDSIFKIDYYEVVMKNIINQIKLAVADSKLGSFMNPVYDLKYCREDGVVKNYSTSRPFDKFNDGFVAYSFGNGIRRFRFDRILDRRVRTLFAKNA